MEIIVATVGAECAERCMASWDERGLIVITGHDGILPAYQRGLVASRDGIIAHVHDDVLIHEPWQQRVLAEFQDPTVGLVGFGGAKRHGHPDLYKLPYDYRLLGRSNYLSNVDDAEVHGARFEGACDVAVLDGFALIVRRSILEKVGGWPLGTPIGYSLYDYWLSCITRRQGYRIRLVGIRCHHLGGQSSVKLKLAEGQGLAHEQAHRYIYDNFSDVLPCEVK